MKDWVVTVVIGALLGGAIVWVFRPREGASLSLPPESTTGGGWAVRAAPTLAPSGLATAGVDGGGATNGPLKSPAIPVLPEVGGEGGKAGGNPRTADEWARSLREDQEQDSDRWVDSLVSGTDLLAVPTPELESLAQILREAGVDEYEIVTGIREVQGHVQRLEQFAGFVREASEEPPMPEPGPVDPDTPAGGPPAPESRNRVSPLGAIFTARLAEYEVYARRSLATRFGLGDAGVVDRIFAVAYDKVPRPLMPGTISIPTQAPGGGRSPTSP